MAKGPEPRAFYRYAPLRFPGRLQIVSLFRQPDNIHTLPTAHCPLPTEY